ncbi:MAG: hydroxymethylbilane synthase [Solirubrobacterales bacterium]|nr:hydroxymethylbilane synthase [Solirubrobacterales bacterium]
MRIGARGSALALAQARLVAARLEGAEVVAISTGGDRGGGGEKARWVDGLEAALLAGEIDLAVHSAKDVPGELAEGLELLASPERAGAEDVLCGAAALEALPEGARVGTSSVRRMAQLRAARADIEVVAMRGNVDTRLRKLNGVADGGGADGRGAPLHAIVLARAGLQRLGREQEIGAVLDPARFVPAPGQGALALEGRRDDTPTVAAARAIGDPATLTCLRAERALARELDATCDTPLGAHARAAGAGAGALWLRAWVGAADGSAWVADEWRGAAEDPEALGRRVAERLLAVGAGELLARAREASPEHA